MARIPLTGPSQDPHLLPANPDHPSDLAIGLELKFLVPFLRAGCRDPAPADPRPLFPTPHADDPDLLLQQGYRLVADILRAASQRAIAISEITSRHARESDFWAEHWIVKKSNSAEPGEREKLDGYVHAPLEISSPRLPAMDSRTYDLIARVVRALEARCRFTVNYTCEVHVHVGRADGACLSMKSLRNFAALCWFVEPTLRLLKDPQSPNFAHVYTWSSPLRQYSRLAAKVSNVRPLARDSRALYHIANAQNELELGRLMSGDEKRYRRLGFNFSAFGLEDERAGRSPRSVEVRFFEDYRGCEEVLGWVRVCVALGVVAIVGSIDASSGVKELTGSSPGENMEGLLRMLGVEENVVALFKRRVEQIHLHGGS
ncbi:hypothetical protein VUR80DRAFT_4888 [Thermomyces stellatus]